MKDPKEQKPLSEPFQYEKDENGIMRKVGVGDPVKEPKSGETEFVKNWRNDFLDIDEWKEGERIYFVGGLKNCPGVFVESTSYEECLVELLKSASVFIQNANRKVVDPIGGETTKPLNYVPYQSCPRCGGAGIIPYNGISINPPCDVCNGAKIIPMAVVPTETVSELSGESKTPDFKAGAVGVPSEPVPDAEISLVIFETLKHYIPDSWLVAAIITASLRERWAIGRLSGEKK